MTPTTVAWYQLLPLILNLLSLCILTISWGHESFLCCPVQTLKDRFTLWTTKSDHVRWFFFPWSDLMVQISCSDLLETNLQCLLDPSLGVNRMWTKRNDHALKNECVDFIIIYKCPKRAVLKNNSSLTILCLLLSSSSLPPKKNY